MTRHRIYYRDDPWQSHARTGAVYKDLLSIDNDLLRKADSCNVIILHEQPFRYADIYTQAPWLSQRYVISYCTWEASELPLAYKASLSLVQEVWTCSDYCRTVIAKHHNNVHLIPHVIERNTALTHLDTQIVLRLIEYDPRCFYYLSFGDTLGTRKNTRALVRCFEKTASEMPNARLVLIGSPELPQLETPDRRIFHLPIRLSNGQINALYSIATAYVSLHHAEGWGLSLSDSILFGRPVIAPAYSGNLQFMSDRNSFLIPSTETFIKTDDVYHLFTTDMKWGEPDSHMFEKTILSFGHEGVRRDAIDRARLATAQLEVFSRKAVLEAIRTRLKII